MKNYYKILDVRETASAGEIRARWIELMRELHPDGKREGEAENPRVKEINEAYGVLKHSSTRAEYDLRTAYYRKKRASLLRKMILPPGILIALLVIGLIYLKKPKVPLLPDSTSSSARGSINKDAHPPSHPVSADNTASNDIRLPNDPNSIKKSFSVLDGKESTTARKPPFSRTRDRKPPATSANKRISGAHLPSAADQKKQPVQPKPPARIRESEPSANVQRDIPPKPSNPTDTVKSMPPLVKSESAITPQNTVAQTSHAKIPEDRPSATPPEESGTKTDPSNPPISVAHLLLAPNSSIAVEGQIAQSKSPSLIATEEEVRKFFALYIAQYTEKDIDGFHSLFSPRAIQNGKYGSDEIRKIYSAFFDQSRELRYGLDDTRIEIYQNAVHVKARYNVKQRLKEGMGKKVWKGDIRWILIRENGILKIRFLDYKQQNSP